MPVQGFPAGQSHIALKEPKDGGIFVYFVNSVIEPACRQAGTDKERANVGYVDQYIVCRSGTLIAQKLLLDSAY